MADIKIYGKLVNKTNGTLADASQIAVNGSTVEAELASKQPVGDYALKSDIDGLATEDFVKDSLAGVEGNISITELESGNIDELLDTGIYTIKTAENAPIGSSGKLEVTATEDGSYQEWITEGSTAHRLAVLQSSITEVSDFYVDGVKTEPVDGEVALAAGGEYTLSGYLSGRIVIGEETAYSDGVAENAPSKTTTIKLNNLTVVSYDQNAIIYKPSEKRLEIIVEPNSRNFILNRDKANVTVNQDASILSNKNLTISGTGLLAIKSVLGGHGIKASELLICGRPYIYVDAGNGHDGIHGSSSLVIEEGYFSVLNCNDGFGTGNNGFINIYGGTFNIHNCKESAFDSKLAGMIEGLTTAITASNCAELCSKKVSIFETVNAIYNGEKYSNVVSIESRYGTGKIVALTESEDADGVKTYTEGAEVIAGVTEYTIETDMIKVSGYISKPIRLVISGSTVFLQNAFIETNSSTSPSLVFLPSSGKGKIKDFEGTSNYIINSYQTESISGDFDAIKSENNLEINTDYPLYVTSRSDDGADGSDVIIRGDGNKYFVKSKRRGIKCTTGTIGADYDNTGKVEVLDKKSDQNLYIIENGYYDGVTEPKVNENKYDSADLYGRNGKLTKGQFVIPARYVTNEVTGEQELKGQAGIVVVGSMKSKAASKISTIRPVYSLGNVASTITGNYVISNPVEDYLEPEFSVSNVATTVGEWTIIKEAPDLTGYATEEFVNNKVIRKYDDISSAQEDLANGVLKLGDIVSVGIGATAEYNFEYVPYIVAVKTPGELALKQINSGTSDGASGNVVLEVTELLIGDSTDNAIADGETTFDCNIGDTLTFKYIFESDNYFDVRGTVNFRLGSTTLGTEKVYPDGEVRSWKYNTSGLTAGTYRLSVWGVESTGKRTETTTYTFKIGGLNVSSTFREEDVLKANDSYIIPITVTSADSTATITAHVVMDDSEILTETVRTGNTSLKIAGEHSTVGIHKLNVYLTIDNGGKIKQSNILEYNIVVAESGVVYAITDSDIYTAAEGTRINILLRAIELDGESYSYSGQLSIYNKSNESVFENKYKLSFGSNLIQLTGLTFNSSDPEIDGDTRYTSYRAVLNVSSDDSDSTNAIKEFEIRITENNYNIGLLGEESLLCAFKSEGMSNLSEEKDKWKDLSGKNVKATFNNFNWKTNGWLADENEDTALTLNGGSYVELDIAPFEKEVGVDGLTISVDFQTEDILDSNAKVISCLYEYDGFDTVVYYLRDAYGDYIKNNQNNIIAYFKYAGGYCWVDGVSYPGDGLLNDEGEFPYEVTYSPSERTRNYNLGDKNLNYNNPLDKDYNPDAVTDLFKFTSSTQQAVTKQRGFYIDTQYAVLSNSSSLASAEDKFHLNFSEKTRTKIDLIITRSKEAPYYFPSMIGYTNGCISLMEQINGDISSDGIVDTDQFIQQSTVTGRKFKVYLGCKATYDNYGNIVTSDTGTSQIYSVRLYNRALSPDEVLNNYAAEIPDFDKKKAVIDNNDLLHNGSIPRTIPEICLIGYKSSDINGKYATKSSINQFIMQLSNTDEGSISDLKAMKEPAYIRYTDVSGDDWNYDGDYILPVRLQFQGTSSMVYPLKNYKFKIYNPTVPSSSGIVGIQENSSSFSYGKKLKFNIGNGIKENTFCLKVDFMDSSHCNNTGSANFISDYNILTGSTPASKINEKCRTTIYGYPVLIYYSDNPQDTNRHFLGVGNLNLDKSCTDSFGLDKEVTDLDGDVYDFGNMQFLEDDFSKDILIRKEYDGDTSELVDSNEEFQMYFEGNTVFGHKMMKGTDFVAVLYNGKYYSVRKAPDKSSMKDYIELVNPKSGIVCGLISEKGYLRSLNNDSISNTQCSEFKANSGATGAGGFGSYNLSSIDADTELRFPDDGDLEDEEYGDYKSRVGKDNAVSYTDFKSPYYFAMQRMIKWVSTANEEEFLKNLDRHFNRNYLMDYYLTILLLGGVDSLGKNLMIGTWGPENHLYKTIESAIDPANEAYDKFAFTYTYNDITTGEEVVEYVTPTLKNGSYKNYEFAEDAYGKPLYYDEDCFDRLTNTFRSGYNSFTVTTVPGECIWYPTFYDIDTIGGLDNAGQLIYDVDIEPGDQLADGTAVYNTSDSHLWSKVRSYLGKANASGESILSNRWATLRNEKFTVSNLVNKFYYERQVSKIPEHYYNMDCLIKYVYEGPSAQRGSGDYLYCAHGSRYEQIKRWYSQRLYYLDTMFGRVGTTAASLRFNYSKCDPLFNDEDDYYASYPALAAKYPENYVYDAETGLLYDGSGKAEIAPINFNFKTYQPGYVGIRWKNGAAIHMKRVKRDQTVTITGNVGTSGDQEVFVYGGSNIKEIGDMYEYNVKSLQFSNLNKLNKLVLGAPGYSSVISEINMGTNTYLSDVQVVNCSSLNKLDLSGCINLKTLDMTGSSITAVSLSSGGALESIAYSSAITSINLNNFTNLSTITAPNLSNLTQFIIKNCPKILGSKDSPNAKAWALLQQTNNAASLTNIEVTSYGVVEQKTLTNGSTFFFPDKYYSYSTAPKIKGEIYYQGTVIPTNYTKFATSYPDLTISYDYITDVSDMFANYNNINLIGTMQVYTGDDIRGNPQYVNVKYWIDADSASQAKWHNTTMYNKYGASNVYTVNTKFYTVGSTYYRLLGIYDDEDLDNLRAEIKLHLSNFKKFKNMNRMFKGINILDYLDPDTFNGIDISDATTDEMFSGCTELRYFELPNDITKSETKIRYKDTAGNIIDILDYTNSELEEALSNGTIIREEYRVDPITGEETSSDTNIHVKGMRKIGSKMFYNCKKVRVYVPETSDNSKISIAEDAFEYTCYDQAFETQSREVTLDRPVIMFARDAKDILLTTSEPTSESSEPGVYYSNKLVEGYTDKYYALNIYGERRINYSNQYIRFVSDTWLREVYFGVKSIKRYDTELETGLSLSYGVTDNGIILFDAKETGESVKMFNLDSAGAYYENRLNIFSITSGALRNLKSLTEIEIPVPKYDCLDMSRIRFSAESSIVGIFNEGVYYTIDTASNFYPTGLDTIYICSTDTIKTNVFTKLEGIKYVGFSSDTRYIEDSAFYGCSTLELVYWSKKETEADLDISGVRHSLVEKIGGSAFAGCVSLKKFNIPTTVTELGDGAFMGDTSLIEIDYGASLTTIPNSTFEGCISLTTVDDFSSNITEIGGRAFYNCTNFKLFNFISSDYEYKYRISFYRASEGEDRVSLNYFKNLKKIGDSAFFGVKGINADVKDAVIKLVLPKTLEEIGSDAFRQNISAPIGPGYQTQFIWDGDYDLDFKNLVIGDRAFYNVKVAFSPTGLDDDLVKDCVFIPKISSIGADAFYAYNQNEQFSVCLAKNTKDEIGDKWVNYTRKVIYEYDGLTSYTDSTGITATYLLSSANEGTAYMQTVTSYASQSITVPTSITVSEKEYTVIQILSGAFDIYASITSLTFPAGSKLELIEKQVLTEANAGYLQEVEAWDETQNRYVTNRVPEGLVIESDNYLAGYLKELSSANKFGFITLGNYIIGYVETEAEKNTEYTLDLTNEAIKTCNIIYDSAFENCNCNKVIFSDKIKYIYNRAFKNAALSYLDDSDMLTLPENLETIGEESFDGCHFKKLYFPANIVSIGTNAFREYSVADTLGSLESVEFAPNSKLKSGSYPFTVQTEIDTGVQSPSKANVTLKQLIVPNSVNWITTSAFSQYQYLSQVTKLYLGNLERDTDGSIYVDNYPLYKTSDGSIVFDSTNATPYTNDDGEQIYCYKFYRDMALQTGNSRYDSLYLETTDAKSVCPVGDIDAEHPGYSTSINLSSIRVFDDADYPSSVQPVSLSRIDLLMILAGYTSVAGTSYTITLKNEAYNKLTSNDLSLIRTARSIQLDHIV